MCGPATSKTGSGPTCGLVQRLLDGEYELKLEDVDHKMLGVQYPIDFIILGGARFIECGFSYVRITTEWRMNGFGG